MPECFWEWYESKGYEDILDKEKCFETPAFLIGCCIEYLTEKGQKVNHLHEQNNVEEIVNYLKTGVAWS